MRTKYTATYIKQELEKAQEELEVTRMPTKNELHRIGMSGLGEGITKTGGFYYWAEYFGFEMKPSKSYQGYKFEMKTKHLLEATGHQVTKMKQGHPFDLLVGGCLRIDVKSSKPIMEKERGRKHEFSLNDGKKECDLYVMYALDEKGQVEKVFVIPATHLAHVQSTVKIRQNHQKYIGYLNRFDYVDTLLEELTKEGTAYALCH